MKNDRVAGTWYKTYRRKRMILNIKTERLQVGMYVDLSINWASCPFKTSRFVLKSDDEIKKIRDFGIEYVIVDTSKGELHFKMNREDGSDGGADVKTPVKEGTDGKKSHVEVDDYEGSTGGEKAKPAIWQPRDFMPDEVVDAFCDKELPPDKRALIVQNYSLEVMKNLFSNPSAEVIAATKMGIAEIVDVILNEDETAKGLTRLVSHDFYTYTHSVNVGIKSMMLAKVVFPHASKQEMDELGAGFFLHDLGKVKISSRIINKTGALTVEEMGVMKTHPYQAYKLLCDTRQLTTKTWIIAMQHHEQDNGTGYPRGLRGNAIHPYARVCSIADVYDALTAKRSYKEQKPPIEALRIMYKEMANHFNAELLQTFISLFKT